MASSSISTPSGPVFQILSTVTVRKKLRNPQMRIQTGFSQRPTSLLPSSVSLYPSSSSSSPSSSFSSPSHRGALRNFVPLAASIAILLWSNPANAGLFSGFSGIESIPGPQLPPIDFLNRFNEENQKKYAEADARFKSSPLLKELLERSKLNKEKNRQEILDKYCIRGAEWGVGDCSTEGMSLEERDKFIAMLKEKAGVK